MQVICYCFNLVVKQQGNESPRRIFKNEFKYWHLCIHTIGRYTINQIGIVILYFEYFRIYLLQNIWKGHVSNTKIHFERFRKCPFSWDRLSQTHCTQLHCRMQMWLNWTTSSVTKLSILERLDRSCVWTLEKWRARSASWRGHNDPR